METTWGPSEGYGDDGDNTDDTGTMGTTWGGDPRRPQVMETTWGPSEGYGDVVGMPGMMCG